MFMFVTNSRTHETAQDLSSTYNDAVDSVVGVVNSTKNVFAFCELLSFAGLPLLKG